MSFDLQPVKPMREPDDPQPAPPKQEIELREDFGVNLNRGKPPIRRSMFFCAHCQKRVDEVAHYGAESYGGHHQPRQEGSYIAGYCKCHGKKIEFAATYAQAWAAIDLGQRITVFGPEDALESKTAAQALSPGPPIALPYRST